MIPELIIIVEIRNIVKELMKQRFEQIKSRERMKIQVRNNEVGRTWKGGAEKADGNWAGSFPNHSPRVSFQVCPSHPQKAH